VQAASIVIVGDRPADLLAALEQMAAEGYVLIVTSGGLGPTADDLTTEIVARFSGRELVLDDRLERLIAQILAPMMRRWPDLDPEAVLASNRKQAMVPAGATVIDPVGTAPGLVVPPSEGQGGPTVVVLPGPPRELQPMWETATETDAFARAVRGAHAFLREIVRIYGIPESEIANSLRAAEAEGVDLARLEITTCLRRAEIEVSTLFEPEALPDYQRFVEFLAARHGERLFSRDGTTIDEQVAALLRGHTVAVGESCTGGLMSARFTDRPGSSAYFAGGVVAYSNEAKTALLGVPAELIKRHGAVSGEVAQALAGGAIARFGAEYGIGITGVAGPDGGSEDRPVGTVWLCVAGRAGGSLTRRTLFPGGRADIRDRSTTATLHLLKRRLLGERDGAGGAD
jgi:nicotinamide-nucleotide amidase